jgi:hypothetical protein
MTLDEAISIGIAAGQLLDSEVAKGNDPITATEAVDHVIAARARRTSTASAPVVQAASATSAREAEREAFWKEFNRGVAEDWNRRNRLYRTLDT